jgi:hypothetical protein
VRQPGHLAKAHVFQYETDNIDNVRVGGQKLTVDPRTNTAKAHLWLDAFEEVHAADLLTPTEEVFRTIGGLNIMQAREHYHKRGTIDFNASYPEGVHPEDLYTRHERTLSEEEQREAVAV